MSRGRRAAATAAGVILFAALLIAAFGVASLATDEDVITAPGLGQVPGVVGVLTSLATFAVMVWARLPLRSIWATMALASLVAFLGYLVGLGVASVVASPDLGPALAAVARASTSWPGWVIIGSAFSSAAMAIAVSRGAAAQARWPWERDDPE